MSLYCADMLSKIDQLESYTGGDQGFLNAYFPDLRNAPLLALAEQDGYAAPFIMSSEDRLSDADGLPSLESPSQGWSVPRTSKSLIT